MTAVMTRTRTGEVKMKDVAEEIAVNGVHMMMPVTMKMTGEGNNTKLQP